jgi:hypothetical protein
MGRKAHGIVQQRVLFTVAVPGSDTIYEALADWLVSQVPPQRRRAVVALTQRASAPDEDSPMPVDPVDQPKSGPVRPAPLRLRQAYDGSRPQTVRLGGHRVQVKVERDSRMEGLNLTVRNDDWFKPLQRMVFTCSGVRARDAVLRFLDGLAAEHNTGAVRQPRMSVATKWGSWQRVHDAPARPLDTVILAEGQVSRIVDDLAEFFAAEALYARVGMPWHRGFLFHGPPGTGKTSAAKALAQHFGLDVYYLPLSDIEDDTGLLRMFADVDSRSMLVIEDIDVVHAAKARDDAEAKGVSMSGLLNARDGFTTPHGLVTIMTTNDLGVLDPALIRPGRADRVVEFDVLDDDQAARLAYLVGTDEPLPKLKGARLTHAELLEAAKPHLRDPDLAHKALVSRIFDARAER